MFCRRAAKKLAGFCTRPDGKTSGSRHAVTIRQPPPINGNRAARPGMGAGGGGAVIMVRERARDGAVSLGASGWQDSASPSTG